MPSLFKVSEAALLAVHAMAYLAVHRGRVVSAGDLARGCASSAGHMAKVCRRLARAGLLASARGKLGGFHLDLSPARVRLESILAVFDGPLKARGCLLEHAACRHAHEPACVFGPDLDRLQQGVVRYFRRQTLAQVAGRCRTAAGGAS